MRNRKRDKDYWNSFSSPYSYIVRAEQWKLKNKPSSVLMNHKHWESKPGLAEGLIESLPQSHKHCEAEHCNYPLLYYKGETWPRAEAASSQGRPHLSPDGRGPGLGLSGASSTAARGPFALQCPRRRSISSDCDSSETAAGFPPASAVKAFPLFLSGPPTEETNGSSGLKAGLSSDRWAMRPREPTAAAAPLGAGPGPGLPLPTPGEPPRPGLTSPPQLSPPPRAPPFPTPQPPGLGRRPPPGPPHSPSWNLGLGSCLGAIYKWLSLLPPPPRGGLTTSAASCAAGPSALRAAQARCVRPHPPWHAGTCGLRRSTAHPGLSPPPPVPGR